jgi:hypothetical protein
LKYYILFYDFFIHLIRVTSEWVIIFCTFEVVEHHAINKHKIF